MPMINREDCSRDALFHDSRLEIPDEGFCWSTCGYEKPSNILPMTGSIIYESAAIHWPAKQPAGHDPALHCPRRTRANG